MKCSLLKRSVVCHLLLFPSISLHSSIALITKEDFLLSLCYSLELCIQIGVSFLFSFAFTFLFTAICKTSSDSHFAFLDFFFLGMVLIPVSYTMSRTSVRSSSGTLSIRSNPLNLFLTSTIRCHFHYGGLECKSRKSRDTWSNRQIWPWSTE